MYKNVSVETDLMLISFFRLFIKGKCFLKKELNVFILGEVCLFVVLFF